MTEQDVIVIGGGPIGCFAALKLAKKGVKVTLLEEHAEIGIPSHCAGHLSINGLKQLGLFQVPKGIIENTFDEATFYSPDSTPFSVSLTKPVTCAINRPLFDKYLAERAENAGATIRLNSRVERLAVDRSGIECKVRNEVQSETARAKMIIDAEGVSSTISRRMGLRGPNRRMVAIGVEAEVENVTNADPNAVEVYFGSKYAQGLYGWFIPLKEGKAKVGLAVKSGNPREFLQRLMRKHPAASRKLRNARMTHFSVHPITLGGPVSSSYAERFLVVGDAASHVKSTTGGGVVLGSTCAAIAAQVSYEAVQKADFSSAFLERYQKRVSKEIGFDTRIMVKVRRTLDAMSDERLDRIIKICARMGLEKTLKDVDDIDFQGRSLLRIMPDPRMVTVGIYLLFEYLVRNP